MPFPLDYRKEIEWNEIIGESPEKFQKRFINKMREELVKADARNISVDGNSISFTAGMFRLVSLYSFNYDVKMLGGITFGSLEIKSSGNIFFVSYYLNIKQYIVLTLLFVLPFAVVALFATNEPVFFRYFYVIALWLFFTCLNYFGMGQRFTVFVKRTLKSCREETIK